MFVHKSRHHQQDSANNVTPHQRPHPDTKYHTSFSYLQSRTSSSRKSVWTRAGSTPIATDYIPSTSSLIENNCVFIQPSPRIYITIPSSKWSTKQPSYSFIPSFLQRSHRPELSLNQETLFRFLRTRHFGLTTPVNSFLGQYSARHPELFLFLNAFEPDLVRRLSALLQWQHSASFFSFIHTSRIQPCISNDVFLTTTTTLSAKAIQPLLF